MAARSARLSTSPGPPGPPEPPVPPKPPRPPGPGDAFFVWRDSWYPRIRDLRGLQTTPATSCRVISPNGRFVACATCQPERPKWLVGDSPRLRLVHAQFGRGGQLQAGVIDS